jgi:hypothetical protein
VTRVQTKGFDDPLVDEEPAVMPLEPMQRFPEAWSKIETIGFCKDADFHAAQLLAGLA